MDLLDRLAEEHIRAAAERGEFDDLPGSGQPLRLDDDSRVPEHLRAGYRLLKNAGFLPPELEKHAEIRKVEDLIARSEPGGLAHDRARRRLSLLQAQLGECRLGAAFARAGFYEKRVLERLGR